MMGDLFGEDEYDEYYADAEDDDYEAAAHARVLPTTPVDPRNVTALCGLQNQGDPASSHSRLHSNQNESHGPVLRDRSVCVGGPHDAGNTCYMNSLLQVMHMTPELRRGLYDLSPEELGLQLPGGASPEVRLHVLSWISDEHWRWGS